MKQLKLNIGEPVFYLGGRYIIKKILSLASLLLLDETNKKLLEVKISEVFPEEVAKNANQKEQDLDFISDKDWIRANKKYLIIKPIIENRGNGSIVEEVSKSSGIHISTLYRWLERYDTTEKISSLLDFPKSGGKGKNRLSPEVDEIINDCLQKNYLQTQRSSLEKICMEVLDKCRNSGLKPPHPNTIKNRARQIPKYEVLRKRYGKKEADKTYGSKAGIYLQPSFPLEKIQIDHTPGDIILVDEILRQPIGRPWITVAIDVYSRMVLGYYISFDPPGASGTGLCLANAIFGKEEFLAKIGIEGEWPCWGIMREIHADNAREFRGNMLKRACEEYGIDLKFRKVASPNYGGHIERLLGTVSRTQIHDLPGTTFSNPKDRKEYDSEGKAALTITELEKLLTEWIVNIYHKRFHEGIGTSPYLKYQEGIFGNNLIKGTGLPPRITNERKLKLDFTPYIERTIQAEGVIIDHIHYYNDVLRRWINTTEPGRDKIKRKFIFRRDPRDISVIYFWDPLLMEYYPIPYKDISKPPMTLWDQRKAIKRLKELRAKIIDEGAIFKAVQQINEIKIEALKKTRAAKVKKSLLREFQQRPSIHIPLINKNEVIEDLEENYKCDITPFEDLEDAAFNSIK